MPYLKVVLVREGEDVKDFRLFLTVPLTLCHIHQAWIRGEIGTTLNGPSNQAYSMWAFS